MIASIDYFGVVYNEQTDWHAFLADVLSGGAYQGLNIDRHVGLSVPDALGELSEVLRGTPMELGLADAALAIIERGNAQEMEIVRSTDWSKAPNSFERMLNVVQHPAHPLSGNWLVSLYGELLRMRPNDARLLDAFTADVYKKGSPASLLSLAARYNLDWLLTHLPSLRPPLSSNLWRWLANAGIGDVPVQESQRAILESNRARLLNAIAELGEPYMKALVEQVKEPPITEDLMIALQSHPAFAKLV